MFFKTVLILAGSIKYTQYKVISEDTIIEIASETVGKFFEEYNNNHKIHKSNKNFKVSPLILNFLLRTNINKVRLKGIRNSGLSLK